MLAPRRRHLKTKEIKALEEAGIPIADIHPLTFLPTDAGKNRGEEPDGDVPSGRA